VAQFYLDGYKPGNPFIVESYDRPSGNDDEFPRCVDVLIVGAGPTGLLLAAQLSNYPDIRTTLVERADGPLLLGQADGVACRTMEVLEAFGLADRVLAEAYQVNEICFWAPDPKSPSRILRTGRVRDSDETISEMPHVTVNQARLLSHLLDYMEHSRSHLRPIFGHQLEKVSVDDNVSSPYPVEVVLRRVDGSSGTDQHYAVRAKYVIGCDGARSTVRKEIGRELVGDITDTSWGVIDVLGITDFPDIRRKCVIKSAHDGNILVIPREGGYLVRLYIELAGADGTGSQVLDEKMTPEHLLAVANRAFYPYSFTAREVVWWSVYNIGQRLCNKFDDVPESEMSKGRLPRVFIAGDACHTHSAKAGQGMNVGIADSWNLGWKLISVLRGRARPELLHTYSAERQAVAQELIDFDREFARAMSAPPEVGISDRSDDGDARVYQRYFEEQLRFTAGVTTCYGPSMIVGPRVYQELAKGFPIGMRFHSAPVIRLADVMEVQLGHVNWVDGAWRIFIFADTAALEANSMWRMLCDYLGSDSSRLERVAFSAEAPDAVIDVRAVLPLRYQDVEIDFLPRVLLPTKGKFKLIDYEKVYCAIPGTRDIYRLREISREAGCIVVVRPDQFVAHVLPLGAHEELTEFMAGIFCEKEASD
jgi:phenol 2-monooxygenase